jgi:steroid delta-isomerase-like uncharacterized protein
VTGFPGASESDDAHPASSRNAQAKQYRLLSGAAMASVGEALIEAGNTAVWTWITSGTWRGAFAGLSPNGKAYTLHGCSLFEVADGRIKSQRAYWDRATWFRQLDIPL